MAEKNEKLPRGWDYSSLAVWVKTASPKDSPKSIRAEPVVLFLVIGPDCRRVYDPRSESMNPQKIIKNSESSLSR
jgi:hypothetical protein